MGLWDRVSQFLALENLQERSVDPFIDVPDLETQLARIHAAPRPWRLPSIREAMGVPAIQRAVTLISNTTGSLSVQGFRDGAVMAQTPRLIARPDPYFTPREFYRDTSYNMATRGETVWWIASRDGDGLCSALVVVPLAELTVEDNPRNRLFPIYTWGTVKGTRFSAANPSGEFVHVTYVKEPGQLRGVGPLQLCGAAASVAVEAQEWAANFFASGGNASILIKSATELGQDENGDSEADALKAQWMDSPNNVPRVIDPGIEDVKEMSVNQQGAQMLAARDYQNGDAARMFGLPGSLLDYSTAGSSLTYQNLEGEFGKFVRACLSPNYLEPIEQALTDLLPRSTVARFSVDGLLRADIKTRFEVYESGVTKSGVLSIEEARQMEGLAPGSVETAPVPFAAPAAVPTVLPFNSRSTEPFRCEGMRVLRGRITACNAKLAPGYVGTCHRCKRVYEASAA